MHGLLWHRSSRQRTATLVVHCPACKALNVAAEGYTLSEQLTFVGLFPIMPALRSHWLTCSQCRESMLCSLSSDELTGLDPEQLGEFIRHRVSPIKKLLAIIAICTFFWPLLGLMAAVPAVLVNLKTRSWTRKVSWIAFVLTLIVHLLFLAIGIFSDTGHR